MNSSTVVLEKIAKISSGGTPDRDTPSYWGGDIPWVKTAQIQNCFINADDVDEWITPDGLKNSAAKMVPKGTILMAMYGQGKTRGQVAILGLDAAVNQACAAIELDAAVSRDYVYQQLLFRYQAIRALSNTGSQENLNAGLIREIGFPLPARVEQDYVAGLLTNWDATIEKTEQLIAAKEISQRGWMQKLVMDKLFPEHRLSEFVHRVNRKNVNGNGHPLTISGRDGLISQSHYFDKRIAAETTEHYTQLKRGEFSYNKSYSAGYPYGAIKRLDAYDEGIVSTLYLCFALNPNAALLSDYLIQFCEVGGFNHQIHKVAQEGARNHGLLNVAADDFFAMKLPVPPIEEQSRVVAILGDAGRELALLRKSLYLLRQQKRGLMQKLLTGQWRAKLPETEPA